MPVVWVSTRHRGISTWCALCSWNRYEEETGELVPREVLTANNRSALAKEFGIGRLTAFQEANGRTPNDSEREVIRSTLFNREERNRFEDALPRSKFNLSARYNLNRVGILAAATYYGSVEYKPANEDHGETFGGKTLIDLEVSCEVFRGMRLSAGANNLLNTFPDEHRKEANIGSRGFIYSRRVTRFGTNGGFYYGRLSLDLQADGMGKSLAEEAVDGLWCRFFSTAVEISLRQIYRSPL